ncbi:chalcone isomerase family protein [Piscinibacter defluvii]|uniref:chalcone isomerase family protein n=1 Tax=Piscinibacter defluvii TaxID=1796922 RepID=UPI000FDD0568|nr:chalcone isomerase family protein [Piscinibacter defluvii]
MHRPNAALPALLLALALAAGSADAAPTATRFDPAVEVQGSKLQLNGAGTRYRAIFKVYDMALYTTKKVATSAELLTLPGPKRLQFVALRELPGTDLGRLFLKGMGDNATREQVQRHTLASTRLIEVFSGRSKMMPGESFAMEFVPGKGTTFYILGKPQGEPVGDDEFFSMVLRIWFGESPADPLLKDALLGQSKE